VIGDRRILAALLALALAAGACASSSGPDLKRIIVTSADLDSGPGAGSGSGAGWVAARTGPHGGPADVAMTRCLGLRVSKTPLGLDGPRLDRGSNRDAVRVTSTAARWSSEANARNAQRAERVLYADCVRDGYEEQNDAKRAAYPIVAPPTASTLPLPPSANTAFRITYALRLADGPATYYDDRITLWRGRISVDIDFWAIERPFDSAIKDRVLARVQRRLNAA
jgi:hypothetical protein